MLRNPSLRASRSLPTRQLLFMRHHQVKTHRKSTHHGPKAPKAAVRSNDWISGLDKAHKTTFLSISDINWHTDTPGTMDSLHAAMWKLQRGSRSNDFQHISIADTQLPHITAAMKVFESDLADSMIFESCPTPPATLGDLILPTTANFPRIINAIHNPTPMIDKFFYSKDMVRTDDSHIERTYYVLEKAFHHHLNSVSAHRSPPQRLKVDISNPAEWYPQARRLKRHLVLHVGPTNSGKTYNALKRLKESNNGVYAGPLRLLAREVYNRFKSEGLRCNLITGEEVVHDLDEFGNSAPLSCSTVEMISMSNEMDVAVIDEIQMIAEDQRGWAWTNALLGVRAKEVHLCGEASIVPLIKRLAAMTGDSVTVNEYQRLGKLMVEKKPVSGGLGSLKKGDCIVVFSKKRIMAYKADIERETKLKVGVIYGALPAETRTEQANKFNAGEYDVLVASDAIGMGLNLNIRRVIFDNHKKFNGKALIDIPIPHVKQIGGRAGRFRVAPSGKASTNTTEEVKEQEQEEAVGYVSAFNRQSLDRVKECMNHDTIMINKASLWPSDEILSQYISEFPTKTPQASIIERFKQEVDKVPLYSIGSEKDRQTMLNVLENIKGMLIADMLTVTTAPLSDRLPNFHSVLFEFGANVANSESKTIFDFKSMDFRVLEKETITIDDMEALEELHKYLMVWLWMNNRFPTLFVNRESAVDTKNLIEDKIDDVLSGMKIKGIGGLQR